VVLVVHPAVVNADGVQEEAARETAVYNHLGQLISSTDAAGSVTRYRYHPENDPDGDGQPNPVPDINPATGGYLAEKILDADAGGPFPPARLTVSYLYDPVGNLINTTDGRGNSTDFLFNQVGELVQYRAPSPFNYRRQFSYDANGNLTRVDIENFTANPMASRSRWRRTASSARVGPTTSWTGWWPGRGRSRKARRARRARPRPATATTRAETW
jgi:uncharacterized protein RhaS with RHS repeats